MSSTTNEGFGLAFRGRRVLITGAAGHIGAALCRRLVHTGAQVTGIVRDSSDRYRIADLQPHMTTATFDLREQAQLRRLLLAQRPEVVFHAAMGRAHGGTSRLVDQYGDSVLATASLLDGLRSIPGDSPLLVHLSSFLVYAAAAQAHKEDEQLLPGSPRGAMKAATEMLVLQQALCGALPAVILRLFTVYGPQEKDYRLIPTAIRAALFNENLPLTEGIARRDYIFVEDVVHACLVAAAQGPWRGERFNVGSGREYSNNEVVTLVENIFGKEITRREGAFAPRETDREFCRADTGKSATSLGWQATTSLNDGLAATLRWMRTRIELEN